MPEHETWEGVVWSQRPRSKGGARCLCGDFMMALSSHGVSREDQEEGPAAVGVHAQDGGPVRLRSERELTQHRRPGTAGRQCSAATATPCALSLMLLTPDFSHLTQPLSLLGDGRRGAPGPVNGRQTLGAACGHAPGTAGTAAQGLHGGGPIASP